MNSKQSSNICFTKTLDEVLLPFVNDSDKVVIFCDKNTRKHCRPLLLESLPQLAEAPVITIEAGDEVKTLSTVESLWNQMMQLGVTRHSLLINLGGGVVTDLGGFAAATYQRGIRFVNIPTSILAIVDASVGSKTGFNFGGLKNQIGLFAPAACVAIDLRFLATISEGEFYAGWAEMLKHALLTNEKMVVDTIKTNYESLGQQKFLNLLKRNVKVKQHYAANDPHDLGLRHALNLGHTFAHAFEALMVKKGYRPISHGTAVMWGLLCALYLSVVKFNFPKQYLQWLMPLAKNEFAPIAFDCNDYETILALMKNDKKNEFGKIYFTLLGDLGDVRVKQEVDKEEIFEALDFIREN